MTLLKILFEELDERFIENFNNLHPSHRVFARHHLGEIMSKEETRRAVVGYHGSCEILDFHVGKVLEGLEMAGLWDDTLVVYSSDHGGTVGEHRNFDHGSMYEGSIRIPLIFCGPGIQAGIVWTNCYHAYPAHSPFGGYKQSGVGRETHKMMLNHYRQNKNLHVSYAENKLGFF